MKFMELNPLEFMEFAKNHSQKNFHQTNLMYNHLKESSSVVYLLGIKNEIGDIVCASLITTTGRKNGKKTFEALKGYLIDYNDFDLLKKFNEEVMAFLKAKGGFRLFISPYVPLIQRDIDGNIVTSGFDNTNQEKNILKLGYKPVDLGIVVKWVFALDINDKKPEELWNDFRPNTRNYINKTINKFKLNVKTLKYDELTEFKKITEDTCERRDFSDKSLEYYQSMYNNFKDLVTFKVVELNCDLYLQELNNEIKENVQKISALSDSVSNKKKKENYEKNLQNCQNKLVEIQKLQTEKGNIIPLSAAMFVLYGDEIIYLFSGSYKEYMHFFGQYRLQWDIIQYAAKNKFKRYNFYGIKNIFDKKSKDYGVYEFKKSFNGYVEELMGPYEIGLTGYYKVYNLLRKIKKIIKRN